MTTTLSTKEQNELLSEAKTLNGAVEHYYLKLAWVLSQVSETETYREAGYETYAEYVAGDLQRSKTFASNMLTVGNFLRANNYLPEEANTSYNRLAISIRAHKDEDAAYVLSAAQTLSESELVVSGNAKSVPKHEAEYDEICRICKNNRFNHES